MLYSNTLQKGKEMVARNLSAEELLSLLEEDFVDDPQEIITADSDEEFGSEDGQEDLQELESGTSKS
jgi:uncharacterized protein YdaT